MYIVIIDGDVSYPPTSGKRLRTLNLMLQSAARHHVAYIGRSCGDGADIPGAERFLRGRGVEPVLVRDPLPRKSGAAFYARLAANLLSPLPYSVASHRSRAMREAVHRYAASHPVDVWQFEWAPYLACLDDGFGGARVVVAHNVDTLIWRRYTGAARGPLRRWFLGRQWRKFEAFERRAFRRADRVIAVSDDDAAILRDDFGVRHVDVVDNGVDTAYFATAAAGTRDPDRVLFLGALDWRPNLDAVGLLLDSIFPQLRRLVPSARLDIVGRKPPAGLARRVAATAGVQLHADVPDVRPFLARSAVMAVPLRVGGGSRLKILEALACGLPVVSTRVGAEGLRLEPGRDYALAEPDEMAAALAGVLQSPGPTLLAAARGREVVLARYDWAALAARQEQAWEAAAGNPVTVAPH